MLSQADEREKLRKEKAKEAIALAMHSQWERAVQVNRFILEDFPEDVEAYNRLGKALTELGHYGAARAAFQRALQLYPANTIARKNLERLAYLQDAAMPPKPKRNVNPHLSLEESGKAGVTSLQNLAPPSVLRKMAAGDPVNLRLQGTGLDVVDPQGEYLGQVEPRLASRLTRLIKGGNRYGAAIVSTGEREMDIIIREVHKDPSLSNVVSFPSRGASDYRPYIRGSLLRYDLADEEDEEVERPAIVEWSEEDADGPELSDTNSFRGVEERPRALEPENEEEEGL